MASGAPPGSSAGGIVKAQQEYATSKSLAKLFEDLTTAIIYARPADPALFVSEEAARMAAAREGYRPAAGVVDTEEAAAAYWEEQRVRQLMEELFALLLACKPEDPLAFLREESLKLQALRAAQKPVRFCGRAGAAAGPGARRGARRGCAVGATRARAPTSLPISTPRASHPCTRLAAAGHFFLTPFFVAFSAPRRAAEHHVFR